MEKKYIPLEKQSKKARRSHYAAQRGDWNGVSPVTRIILNRKKQQCLRETRRPVHPGNDDI